MLENEQQAVSVLQANNGQSGLWSGPEQPASERKGETDSQSVCIETPEEKFLLDHTAHPVEPGTIEATVASYFNKEELQPCSKHGAGCYFVCGLAATKRSQLSSDGLVMNANSPPKGVRDTSASVTATIKLGLHPDNLELSTLPNHVGLPLEIPHENHEPKPSSSCAEDMAKFSALGRLKTPTKSLVKKPVRRGRKPLKNKKKYMLRSLASSDRGLRKKSQEIPKAPELSKNFAEPSSREEKKRRKRAKKVKRNVLDEYSRMRKHLRYLLHRISYEQSLITAYSTEGWKGLSLEKLKPEKELERARSEILRRKLKIRDLFQHLDSVSSEGRLPELLFDSEGEIDSEDIFCSKCGSKDLSANNDIILCDGACDRGFHQYCLEPPLLKEEIPPDDESWLCPGCDCKADCVDLVNESQGTNLSITGSWEKVFPEAAAGHNQDPNFGLPSDDSDDHDYNPDGPQAADDGREDKDSTDDSDFTSASEELQLPPKTEQYMGLPSDDSDDDDYDPDAPHRDDISKQESSSSDFTSDSEDLCAVIKDDVPFPKDARLVSTSHPRHSKGRRSELGGKHALNNELLSRMESTSGPDSSAHVPEKRSTERLDYKKLYDDTYGNVPCSSSDDDDWTDATAPRKRNRSSGVASLVSPGGNSSLNGMISGRVKQNPEVIERTPRKTTGCKSKSATKLHGSPSKPVSTVKIAVSSTTRRLGEAVTQRLHESFKENQYPNRAVKESLAEELQLTFRQVNKWFENTRWHFNHPSQTTTDNGSVKNRLFQQQPEIGSGDSNCNGTKNVQSSTPNVACREHCNGDTKDGASTTRKKGKEPLETPSTRKKKGKC